MFSILRKLFSSKPSVNLIEEYDDKYDCIEIKNNKLSIEEVIYDKILYVHERPKPPTRNKKMPSKVEIPDNVNTNQVEVIDQKTGKKMMLDSNQASQMQEKVPDGINVPGLGRFDSKSKNQGKQQPRQSPPQNQQPPQQPRQQQQQPPQGYPQQQPPQQQQQQQQPPQGYPQQQPPQQQPPQQQVFQPPGWNSQQNGYNVIPDYNQRAPQQVPVGQGAGQYLPPSEIAMVEGAYHVYVDLPGVSKKSLNVSFNAGTLNISGERVGSVFALRKQLKGNKRKEPILTEHNTVPQYLVGKFDFKYPFQRLIDESKLEANMVDGVLHVMLPHRVKGEEVSIPIM